MKKFYLLTLGLGIAAITMASAPVKSNQAKQIEQPKVCYTQAITKAEKLLQRAPQREQAIESLNDVVGEYKWSYTTLLTNSPDVNVTISVASEINNEVYIDFFTQDFVSDYSPIVATVDLEAGTITIPNDWKVGEYADAPVYFYLKGINDDGNVISGISEDKNVVGTISNGVISFPYLSVWALGNYEDETPGWYAMTYDNQFSKVITDDPDIDPNEGWNSLGYALFVDPWVIPAFGEDQYEYEYEVELQQNEENEYLYRLVDPYMKNCPVGYLNQSTAAHGYIQFNMEDPLHITFDNVEAGFANSSLGVSKLYCSNRLSYWINRGNEKDFVIEVLGGMIPYTRYADGVITLSYEDGNVDEDGNKLIQYDACFGNQTEPMGAYSWVNGSGNPIDMTGRITFPTNDTPTGINTISTENSTPVYYNLQGQRVANPDKGIYIRVANGKAQKIVR